MREGISIEVSAADRDRLERIVADRNSRKSNVWRARIILATTSCSWLNAVETFFATLTRRRQQRSAFPSLVDLQVAINHQPLPG